MNYKLIAIMVILNCGNQKDQLRIFKIPNIEKSEGDEKMHTFIKQ